jgi:hypothetical protein
MRRLAVAWAVFLLTALGAAAGTFDYADYAIALKRVDDRGMVDYADLKEHPAELNAFLDRIARLDPAEYDRWSDPDKIAFWINAYNAITLRTIIDHYPIKSGGWIASLRFPTNSIRQIDGAWDKLTRTVMGKAMTLDEIEHETLRKKFHEPRIHMTLVCAAMGCPPLRNEPYVGATLDEQFADQTRKFLSNDKKFRIDRRRKTVYLSSIFKWFGEDFIAKYGTDSKFAGHSEAERAVLNYLSDYLPLPDARWLGLARYDIKYLDYDWSLNEQ